ncbi:hypothetical protein QL996_13395 [Planococcus sp. APC 4015]|nr:hypothetical protein [Planococcus sp. APC 4015]
MSETRNSLREKGFRGHVTCVERTGELLQVYACVEGDRAEAEENH